MELSNTLKYINLAGVAIREVALRGKPMHHPVRKLVLNSLFVLFSFFLRIPYFFFSQNEWMRWKTKGVIGKNRTRGQGDYVFSDKWPLTADLQKLLGCAASSSSMQ